MKAVFIHLNGFRDDLKRIGMTDEDLQGIEQAIMRSPTHPVMSGTGGIRKMRFSPGIYQGGKSGACRVCYVWFDAYAVVLLVIAFGKKEQDNLTPKQKSGLKKVVEFIRLNLSKGRY